MTRLIGSKQEKDIRTNVFRGNRSFSLDSRNRFVIEYIVHNFGVSHFFVVNEIPDQDIEILTFLVADRVVVIERDRGESSNFSVSKTVDREDYLKGKNKRTQILFEIILKEGSIDNGVTSHTQEPSQWS